MISAPITITEQDLREQSTSKNGRYGQYGVTEDGRMFRYAKAGAVDLAPGKLNTAAAVVANHVGLTAAATSIGATTATFTLGATAATQDQYAEGYLNVTVAPGAGQLLKVVGNSAASSSGSITVNLQDPLLVALTTSSRLGLHKNPFDSVIISAAAVALQAVGVANVAVTAGSYGWLQVGGYCSVLSDGIVTKGAGAIISDAVAGAVEIEVAGTLTQRVGTAIEASVDTQYNVFNLSI